MLRPLDDLTWCQNKIEQKEEEIRIVRVLSLMLFQPFYVDG